MKYLSRKFALTAVALIGCLFYAFTSPLSGMEVAAVIGAIAALVGQYSASNAISKGKGE
jgi:uncharacterized membrane protein